MPRTPADERVLAELGRRVRERRRERGLSQERLAELAELHRTFAGAVERGESNVSVTTLVRIARVLDVDVGELVRGLAGE